MPEANEISAFFKALTGAAKNLGGLEASAIWALVSIALYYRAWKSDRNHEEYDKQWQEIRTQEAVADTKMADAVERLARVSDEHKQETLQIRLIIDERLLKRS